MIIGLIVLYLVTFIINGLNFKSGILACGLAGFYPKTNKSVDIQKMIMLNILNEERGTDSCGVGIGNYRAVGTGHRKKFRDFADINIEKFLRKDYKNKSIIFHTRRSSFGADNDKNSHPFLLELENDDYIMLAHNGVLKQEYALKTSFFPDVDYKELGIDSHYLVYGLGRAHEGKINRDEFLKAYKGDAAILFYTKDTYNVWKGGYNDVEERPMYYISTEDGYYFCSIESSLNIVFGGQYPITEVSNNQLLTFTKVRGKVKIQKQIIERKPEPIVMKPKQGEWSYNFEDDYNDDRHWEGGREAIIRTDRYSHLHAAKAKREAGAYPRDESLIISFSKNALQMCCDNMPLTGRYRSFRDPAVSRNISIIRNSSSISAAYIADFADGYNVADIASIKTLRNLQRKWTMAKTIEDFIVESYEQLEDIVVDYLPFMYKNKVYLLFYRDEKGDLLYRTGHDKNCEDIIIKPKFGDTFFVTGDSSSNLLENGIPIPFLAGSKLLPEITGKHY